MIETIILVPILWIVMSAIYMLLLKNFEGTKGITQEYKSKDGTRRTAKKNMEKNNSDNASSGNNWMGPDGTESGPDVPEDWYLSYGGPAPVVEDIYDENYAVDRGNGAIPIQFYVKKWGVPEGFEEETEKVLTLHK